MGCLGRGLFIIILDVLIGKLFDVWVLIVFQIFKEIRVCVYDRVGLGFSDRFFVNWLDLEQLKRGKLFTSERMVEDFYRFFILSFDQLKFFIFVGVELGVVNVRFYIQMFESDVVSFVLINFFVEGMFNDEWIKLWYERYVFF